MVRVLVNRTTTIIAPTATATIAPAGVPSSSPLAGELDWGSGGEYLDLGSVSATVGGAVNKAKRNDQSCQGFLIVVRGSSPGRR
jgi:hypothetical protein